MFYTGVARRRGGRSTSGSRFLGIILYARGVANYRPEIASRKEKLTGNAKDCPKLTLATLSYVAELLSCVMYNRCMKYCVLG